MDIIITKNIGFCNGVNNAVKQSLSLSNKKVYCLGEIVHNENVIKQLENKGIITINSIEDAINNETVIIRAHGEPKKTYQIAKQKNINIVDLTCVKVKLIHKKVEKEAKDKFIIIIGKKSHPETIATKSYAGENSIVISEKEEIPEVKNLFLKSNLQEIYVVVQTTYSKQKFNEITEILKNELKDTNIIIDNTLCNATTIRQKEAEDLAKKVNLMLVVGGTQSSNTKELYNIIKKNINNVYLIQDKKDLKNININKNDIIGITSGTSTNIETINEIIKELKNRG